MGLVLVIVVVVVVGLQPSATKKVLACCHRNQLLLALRVICSHPALLSPSPATCATRSQAVARATVSFRDTIWREGIEAEQCKCVVVLSCCRVSVC